MFRAPAICFAKSKVSEICKLTVVRGIQSGIDGATGRETSSHYDIIVAGGGLVGTTLACSLAKNKTLNEKRILLLEGAPKFKGFTADEYSNRVSALSHGTLKLLKSIGAWETIAAARFKPVKQMQIWDASSHAMITFNHDNFADDVAYIVENDLVLHAVYEMLNKLPNVEVKNLSRVEDVQLPSAGATKSRVTLKDGETISCDLLVGADGINSVVRKKMKVEPFTMSYNQMGLVATLQLSDTGDNSVAWQRFIPTGPLALLPLNDTMSSLVWTTTPEHAKQLLAMPPQEFVDALNDAFYKEYPQDSFTQNILGTVNSLFGGSCKTIRQYPPAVTSVKENSRACFPLGFGHAPSYVTEGAVLVGDAAHRVHPLAGQGVNLGFGDVKCLTDVLSESVYSGFNLGAKHYLLKYERERLMKNLPMMVGIHGLQQLYNTTFSPIVMLRSVGLQITQNLPPLKKLLMQQAMG